MATSVLTVFEHETLRVGEERGGVHFSSRHHEALARLASRQGRHYFYLGHQKVQFRQYVGIIQLGRLTIEILPKADRKGRPGAGQWRGVLLEMLRSCRLLPVTSGSVADQDRRPGALLDIYIEWLLVEMERLLREGLLRTYRPRRAELGVLKGRLLLERQLRKNPAHQEKLQVAYWSYDYDHPFNRILGTALAVLARMPLSVSLHARLRRVRREFPATDAIDRKELELMTFSYERRTLPYRSAVEVARLLITGFSPVLKSGRFPALAILFDMNLLFEEYVYHQLAALRDPALRVFRQQRRPFWRRRFLRPDIVLERSGDILVLDTKWKTMRTSQPTAADLRQVLVYSQYFGAQRGVLIYPDIWGIPDLPPAPYHSPGEAGQEYFCQVCFLDPLKNGRLNTRLGEELVARLWDSEAEEG